MSHIPLSLGIQFIQASTQDFGFYRIGEQPRLRPACTKVQADQSLHCLHTKGMGEKDLLHDVAPGSEITPCNKIVSTSGLQI